jgi:uncharacterized protein (DUF362 family)
VPKVKTHTLCFFGGAMKNQFGCNPHPRKSIYHKRLNDAIVDVTAFFKPQLIVVDGIIAMEGSGPVSGIPKRMNTLILGRDIVAVDHLIARIVGINPHRIKYLVEAEKRGLGTTMYEINGKSLKEVAQIFKRKPKRSNLYGLLSH